MFSVKRCGSCTFFEHDGLKGNGICKEKGHKVKIETLACKSMWEVDHSGKSKEQKQIQR